MPIYVYECKPCSLEADVLQPMGATEHDCAECGQPTVKKPTCQSLVFMGGSPTFRRQHLGTAPFTPRGTAYRERHENGNPKGGPGSRSPDGVRQGKAWLENLA